MPPWFPHRQPPGSCHLSTKISALPSYFTNLWTGLSNSCDAGQWHSTVYLFRTAWAGASCPPSCFMNGIYLQCKNTVQNIGWSTEAKGHRDVVQKGVLPSLAGGVTRQVWVVLWWTVRTASSDRPYRLPWQMLLSYELLVIPAPPAA
jgi:hypothetical protein